MIEEDTVRLLRECDAGVKMGVDALEEVLPYVEDDRLREKLENSRHDHEELDRRLQRQLFFHKDEGKDPNPVAKGMSRVKTNVRLAMHEGDATIADLITDGCDMGVKSLRRYLNQYKAADEDSKDIAKDLIGLEEHLRVDLAEHL